MPAKGRKIQPATSLSIEQEEMVKRLIYRSCQTLDAEDFASYLQLCTNDFRYRIVTYSPEIRKDMVWLEHDRTGLKTMLDMIPQHVRMPGRFMRHAVVYSIDWTAGGKEAQAVSSLMVVYTEPEGASRLFAAGHYRDTVDVRGDMPRLKARETRLETRDLGPGSHLPM